MFLTTPGRLTRWIIRDMRVNRELWTYSAVTANWQRNFVLGQLFVGERGVGFEHKPNCRHEARGLFVLHLGPLRRWRLRLAVRRLAAWKISEELP